MPPGWIAVGIVPFSNGQEPATEQFSKLLPLFAHNSIVRAGLTEAGLPIGFQTWLLRSRALRFGAVFQVIADISAVVGTGNGLCALHTFFQGNRRKYSSSPGEAVLLPSSQVHSLHLQTARCCPLCHKRLCLRLSYSCRLHGAACCAVSVSVQSRASPV